MDVLPFVALFVLYTPVLSEKNPVVKFPELGQIEGGHGTSLNGRTVFSFEGVPYAQAPIGENRFKEPLPLKPWNGIWEAKTIYKCMQYNQFTPPGQDYVIGDEDCLYLNIYTPTLDQGSNLDVIVYIHGGAFMFNWGGLQGPEYLLDKDVVVVTLNYRLGPLGFLSTEDKVLPGNNGMRDQIFALQFIQKHIHLFGGNSKSITIMGMSAGGASVHFHYLSPKSRNLFHRGWSMSGSTLLPWVLMEQPLDKTKKLATLLGCGTSTSEKMVQCLKTRPGRQIVAMVKKYQPWLYTPFSPFGLVVDSWAKDPVLPQHPYQLLKSGQVYDVPWIASYTNSEGLYPAADFLVDDQYLKDVDQKWNQLLPLILDYNYTVDPKKHDEVSEKIRQYYLGGTQVSRSTFHKFIPVVSDRIFVVGIQKTARLQSAVTKSSIYSYLFTYRGAHSWSEYCGGTNDDFGASHGDDTAYCYKIKAVDTTTNEQDRKMVKFFVHLLTSFAKNGVPKVPIGWPAVPKSLIEEYTYLQIDSPQKLSVGKGTLESTNFWDSLPIMENEKLFPEIKDEL